MDGAAMYRSRCALLLASSTALFACGAPPPPAKAPEPAPAKPEPGAIASGPTPDLSPVPAPASLVAVGRLGNPIGAVDLLAGWAKFPVDIRALASKNEPELASLLVFDAPIELAVALDENGLGNVPQPFAVVSLGVSSVDATVAFAKRKGQSVRMQRPGVYQIVKGESPVCAVAAAAGKAPARLVCGDRQEDIDALLAYATRGLPTESFGKADLHVELRAEPLRRRYAKELRQLKTMATPFVLSELSMDSPRFDRALADAVHGLTDEVLALSEDVDKIRIEANLDRGAGMIDAKTSFKFRGQSSWTVQTMVDASKRGKGVPEMFWKLPKESELATFGVGANAKRYETMRKTLAELMDGALEKEKVPRKVRDQLSELLLDSWTTEGDVVYAHGEVTPPPAPAEPGSAAAARERVRAQLGWYIVGLDEKPAKYKGYLDKVVKLYNDAQLRQVVDKRLKIKPAALPKLASRGGRGLPAGATVYELVLPGAYFEKMEAVPTGKQGGVPALSIVVILVPDGDRTWVGFSADEKALTAKLVEMKKGDSTLASREGIAPLKTSKGVSGGFFTVGNLVKGVITGMGEAGLGDASKALRLMPNHGETPMLMWTSVEPAGPDVVWSLRVPKAVVEDLGAVGPALAAQGSGSPPMAPAPPPPPRTMKKPGAKKP